MKYLYWSCSFLFLIYLFLPEPHSINDFPPLPNSVKSTQAGDTWQIPNTIGYFSNNYRDEVMPFYVKQYANKSWVSFNPIRLNYPPEFAFTAIKVETPSTYLEEIVYPLKGSLYVNGLEHFEKDSTPKFDGAYQFSLPEGKFNTKVTLRYYPSPLYVRFIVWIGINVAFIALWKVGKKVVYG